jgi:uncharacterized membrane protein SpoIIM required for sporulation
MNLKRWIARREANWQRLETLLKQVERRGLRSLQTADVKTLASLYRSVTADLARARTYQAGETLIHDLQQLTARAYTQIYQGARRQEWQRILYFYQTELPQVLRTTWPYIAIATTLFAVGGLIGWWYAWQDPKFLALVVPPSLIHQVQDEGELWMGSILGLEPVASSSIMVNNLAVSFKTIAGGMLLGLGTIYILFLNGVLIGAIATLVGQNGLAFPFWAFVFPHGSLELPAIFLAGGSGFLIARAVLLPGRYRRIDALRYYGLLAAKLVYGLIPMLIIAGVIEGFFSPSPLFPALLKYIVGIGLLALFLLYCSRPGTPATEQPLLFRSNRG